MQYQGSVAEHSLASEREIFLERAAALGLGGLESFHWYHVVDLGDGLVTPGQFDYRGSLDDYGFDADLTGRTVLDVGSATGFFAFEFERRGAQVTSLELASLEQLDRFPGQPVDHVVRRIVRMLCGDDPSRAAGVTPESLYRDLLAGPFDACRRRLRSGVRRAYLSVYDASPHALGVERGFDFVFASDVLWHTIDPLRALAAIASVCRDRLSIVQPMPRLPGGVPAMVYEGGDAFGSDELHWYAPTPEFFVQTLRKLGFGRAWISGSNRTSLRFTDRVLERTIVDARRGPADG